MENKNLISHKTGSCFRGSYGLASFLRNVIFLHLDLLYRFCSLTCRLFFLLLSQRRWPSCRSTSPCSGRSMWRCSRSWPTQRGAVPCLLRRPLSRVQAALQLPTPSLAACWTSSPTSISRSSTGEEHYWSKWARVGTIAKWWCAF